MSLVAGYQVVGTGSIGTLQKLVVAGVRGDLERMRWADEMRTVLYELEELLPESPADFKFRACEHLAVFRENGFGDVQPGRFRDCKHEDGALESVRFQGSRDEDIGINNKPKRNHPRLSFCARVALMTWSIWRELSLSVPFRLDSSPIARSTSGSGAASRT